MPTKINPQNKTLRKFHRFLVTNKVNVHVDTSEATDYVWSELTYNQNGNKAAWVNITIALKPTPPAHHMQ